MTMKTAEKVFSVHSEKMNKKGQENQFMVSNSQEICFRMLMDQTIFASILIGLRLILNMKEILYNHAIMKVML